MSKNQKNDFVHSVGNFIGLQFIALSAAFAGAVLLVGAELFFDMPVYLKIISVTCFGILIFKSVQKEYWQPIKAAGAMLFAGAMSGFLYGNLFAQEAADLVNENAPGTIHIHLPNAMSVLAFLQWAITILLVLFALMAWFDNPPQKKV
jgi:hypothetical protein